LLLLAEEYAAGLPESIVEPARAYALERYEAKSAHRR